MRAYLIDAFTNSFFSGNPAYVCLPEKRLGDETMQRICLENGVPDCAFAYEDPSEDGVYELRFFTPTGEITLCGHSALACAYVLLNVEYPGSEAFTFVTKEGRIRAGLENGRVTMSFPAFDLTPVDVTEEMVDAIGATPLEAYMGRDLLCVFENEDDILALDPDMDKLMAIDGLLLQATAPGTDADCVSRSFSPKLGVPEDPVCGSGHCHIIPYWAGRTGKKDFVAKQASKRGGTLYCRLEGNTVRISGDAAVYSKGEIFAGEE